MPNRVRYGIGSGFGALSKELADQADEERRAEIARQSARLSQQVTQSHEDRARYEGYVGENKMAPEDAAAITGLPVSHFQRFAAQQLPNTISGLNAAIMKSTDTQTMGGPEQWKNAMRPDVPRYTGPLVLKDAPPDMLDWKGSGAQDALDRLQAAVDEHAQMIKPDAAYTTKAIRPAADSTPDNPSFEDVTTPGQFLRNPLTNTWMPQPVPGMAPTVGPSTALQGAAAGSTKLNELRTGDLSPQATKLKGDQGLAVIQAETPGLVNRSRLTTRANAEEVERGAEINFPKVLDRNLQTKAGEIRTEENTRAATNMRQEAVQGVALTNKIANILNPKNTADIYADIATPGFAKAGEMLPFRMTAGFMRPGTRAYMEAREESVSQAQQLAAAHSRMSEPELARAGYVFPTLYDFQSGMARQKLLASYANSLNKNAIADAIEGVSDPTQRARIINESMARTYQRMGLSPDQIQRLQAGENVPDNQLSDIRIPDSVPAEAPPAAAPTGPLGVAGQTRTYAPGSPVLYQGKQYRVLGVK